MDRIRVRAVGPLQGQIAISGAKNAALPLLACALLTDQPFTLTRVPHLADIRSMITLLQMLGVTVAQQAPDQIQFQASNITSTQAPYDLVRKMRASIVVLGPLLARMGQASISLPGGCAIGTRPVNVHLDGLQAMGADIQLVDGYIEARAPQGLRGATYHMPLVTVTGTENLVMAAALATGTSVLTNAAREPEVVNVCQCLQAMGAQIDGIGTDTLTIHGRGPGTLSSVTHAVLPDRIETGTYMIAGAITRGHIRLTETDMALLPTFTQTLERAGVRITGFDGGIEVDARDIDLRSVDITTEPYPGFPTDLQAQFMALMTTAAGASCITETIFENRFMHVPELIRMGADIVVHGSTATVRGPAQLRGAPVMATDLRASVSLVLAGLVADGETIVNRVYHLDRGYEAIEAKLGALGADVARIAGEEEDAVQQAAINA